MPFTKIKTLPFAMLSHVRITKKYTARPSFQGVKSDSQRVLRIRIASVEYRKRVFGSELCFISEKSPLLMSAHATILLHSTLPTHCDEFDVATTWFEL
uniref:AlNc14C153G7588 protein n=1 Tax=Albugo laibachii Nc14 TaxID=890382 RepID=F0WM84_9STRA|nr:AlNc14C153G7588 [Albugo laibachii Nc14]|eukprot:CCA22413.1 AlNc14C153G7588 [Albugo laibachii Nc14]